MSCCLRSDLLVLNLRSVLFQKMRFALLLAQFHFIALDLGFLERLSVVLLGVKHSFARGYQIRICFYGSTMLGIAY